MKTEKIYLVDDDTFSLNLYAEFLRSEGYSDITLFEDGDLLLKNLDSKPQVVFLDHHLTGLTGFEILKKIKRSDPNIYVIMISGQEDILTAVESLKHGAFDYILKGSDELLKMKNALQRVSYFDELLNQAKPSFLKRLFSIL